jgi:hypothetical protein
VLWFDSRARAACIDARVQRVLLSIYKNAVTKLPSVRASMSLSAEYTTRDHRFLSREALRALDSDCGVPPRMRIGARST